MAAEESMGPLVLELQYLLWFFKFLKESAILKAAMQLVREAGDDGELPTCCCLHTTGICTRELLAQFNL